MSVKPFCALCLRDLPAGAQPLRRPFGRGDAMVSVCADCDEVHPRSGRYAFDDGAAQSTLGDGNLRVGRLGTGRGGRRS